MVTGYDPVRHADVAAARRRRQAVKEEWAALHRRVTEKLAAAVEADELKPGELVAAFTATGNRAHGQPTQPLSGPDGGPIQSKIEVAITYADDPPGSEAAPPAGAADPDA